MTMTRSLLLICLVVFSPASVTPLLGEITVLAPTQYLSAADSPFDMAGLGTTFFLEDFEDDVLDLPPGILSINSVITEPGPLTDSVDGDDGLPDGSGSGGHSLKSIFQYVNPSLPPITNTVMVFQFDEQQLGFLPKSFGFVWTDGMPNSRLSVLVFEANSQGGAIFEPLMDSSYTGQTGEDRFIGFTSTSGITWVSMENQVATFDFVDQFEIDHVQFGMQTPEGSSWICAILALVWILRH